MKIAFVGKGGSGKTTLSSLFIRFLASQSLPVLAIDGDINQHLGQSLVFDEQALQGTPPLGLEMLKIKEYLRGSNPRIASAAQMVKTTPPGFGSRLIRFGESNTLLDYFAASQHNIKLLLTGPFTEADMGVSCYHSKLGAVELLLNHLIDSAGQYIITDMTAGADSFASGLFTKFDLTCIVVEPTLKSLEVYRQYIGYAKDFDVPVRVIGNKIEQPEDEQFIREHVGAHYIGSFSHSPYVRSMEQGRHSPFDNLEDENKKLLAVLQRELDTIPKDWEKFYKQTVEFHIKNAVDWANAIAGEDLTTQVDPRFNLKEAIGSIR
jgi:CO dehydrogenase maturation factor